MIEQVLTPAGRALAWRALARSIAIMMIAVVVGVIIAVLVPGGMLTAITVAVVIVVNVATDDQPHSAGDCKHHEAMNCRDDKTFAIHSRSLSWVIDPFTQNTRLQIEQSPYPRFMQ